MSESRTHEWTRDQLRRRGFIGWVPWSACPSALAAIPPGAGGPYVVLRSDHTAPPTFLERSTAGVFQRDPTVARGALVANWVTDAHVVYIGQANHGRLRARLCEYVSFGRGANVGHRGGRLIWQLAEAQNLVVTWRILEPGVVPKQVEDGMIIAFASAFGQPPFANDPHLLGRISASRASVTGTTTSRNGCTHFTSTARAERNPHSEEAVMYGDPEDARTIETGNRSFLIDRETTTPPGWLLREFYRDGWPMMAGPFPTAEEAAAYIDALIEAGPLCDYEDEHGNQSCWVQRVPPSHRHQRLVIGTRAPCA